MSNWLQSAKTKIAGGLVRAAFPGIMKAMAAAYDAAGNGRMVRDWDVTGDSINTLIEHGGDDLVRRSRDTVRRNPYAASALRSFVGNAIGTGIVPEFQHPDPAERNRLKKLWLQWTDEADADGLTDFYGLQSLACRSTLESGECIARIRPRRLSDGLTVPLQVQLLEAEHLPRELNQPMPGGNVVRWGIEYDRLGRRAAYHLYREHPGEVSRFFASHDRTRVPASLCAHLYKPLRPGQQRGEPWLSPILLTIYQLEQYTKGELMRMGVASMFAGVLRDIEGGGTTGVFGDEADTDGTPMQGIEPGTWITLPPNKTVEFSKPPDIGSNAVTFIEYILRKIAAGMGITYEQMTGDLRGVNYSSLRHGLLEFRRGCEQFQHQVIVHQFCRPIAKAWIESAVLSGQIDAVRYTENPRDYLDIAWKPQKWDWVDPVKDINAEVLAIDNLLKSRSESIASMGNSAEDVDEDIRRDQDRELRLNLRRGVKSAPRVEPVEQKSAEDDDDGQESPRQARKEEDADDAAE